MATRSRIGFETASGAVMHVYCHYDGYVEGVGKALVQGYNDVTKAYDLVIGGSCSTICNTVQRFTSDSAALEISWAKDRQSYKNENNSWEEYQYLWDSRKACWLWRKADGGNWKRVDLALRKINNQGS